MSYALLNINALKWKHGKVPVFHKDDKEQLLPLIALNRAGVVVFASPGVASVGMIDDDPLKAEYVTGSVCFETIVFNYNGDLVSVQHSFQGICTDSFDGSLDGWLSSENLKQLVLADAVVNKIDTLACAFFDEETHKNAYKLPDTKQGHIAATADASEWLRSVVDDASTFPSADRLIKAGYAIYVRDCKRCNENIAPISDWTADQVETALKVLKGASS